MRLPQGESGLTKQRLNPERLDLIAKYWALPTKDREPEAKVCKAIGISPASLRKWRTRPDMMKRVKEFVDREILYMMPDVVAKVFDGAMGGDIKAQRALLEMGGYLKAGGGVTLNNTVVQPTMFEGMSDEDFIEQFERTIRERRVDPDADN